MGKRSVEITVTATAGHSQTRHAFKKGRAEIGRALPRGFAINNGVAQRRGMSWALIASVAVAGAQN